MPTNFFAQESKLISGKILAGTSSIDIPTEVKSQLIFKENSSEFIKIQRFSETLKGTITVISDSNNKFVGIILPDATSNSKMVSIGECIKKCWKDWNCFWDCMLN